MSSDVLRPELLRSRTTRRLWIDWLRGWAVLFMIGWHSIDSWSVVEGRDTTAFGAVMFFAGWAAPLFLFLAGVSVPLAAFARMMRGTSRSEASWALQKRGWQIFLLAHVFRLQGFLFNPNGTWSGVLKPDILNILGLSLVAAAWCWRRAKTERDRWIWLVVPVLAVLVLAPWSRHWSWPTLLHPRLEAYIRPNNFGVFSLLPASAFVFAGTFLGDVIATHDDRDWRFQLRMALVGLGLLVAGTIGLTVPTPWTAAWADSATLVTLRVGTMTAALACSWWVLRRRSMSAWDPLLVFGRTSMFVYWVHVEIAYGVFSYALRHTLTLPWAVVAYLLLTLFMYGAALVWERRPRMSPLIPEFIRA